MAITSTDDSDILNLLASIPSSRSNEIEQTLLFFNFYNYPGDKRIENTIITDKLNNIKDQYNIILLCFTALFSKLCAQSESWLQRRKVIYTDIQTAPFNPHLHTILLDLINNPTYDWQERYQSEWNSQCSISEKIEIIIWKVCDFSADRNPPSAFTFEILKDLFSSNVTLKVEIELIFERPLARTSRLRSKSN